MKSVRILALVLTLLVCPAWLRADPPRVVSTTPHNGQADVDPQTRKITIVFDQPMSHGGHSIVGGGPNFPKIVGKPQWADDRTFVMDVQLEADHDYAFGVNSDRFTNFRNARGEPASPLTVRFSTAAPEGATKLSPEQNRESIHQLRNAIDRNYSYRDLRKVDWHRILNDAAPQLEQAATPREFARQTAKLLAAAEDVHVVVKAGNSTFPTRKANAAANFDLQTVSRLVDNWSGNDVVYTGRFEDGIVYVLISTWNRDATAAMEEAFEAVAEASKDPRGLIIDVRPNSGGDEELARSFAGCFVDQPRVYSKNRIRRDGQWLGPYDRVVEPNPERPAYRGPLVVLMGPRNMSSCESFLLMMRQVPGCKLVGERSYGTSGNPKPFELANGVTVLLPSWEDLLPDGSPLESAGIVPDIEVKSDPLAAPEADPVLHEALRMLRSDR
jgi:hypothetical protein